MSTVEPSLPALPPGRGIRATWWYTLAALVFFELVVAGMWTLDQIERGRGVPAIVAAAALSLVWCAASVVLMRDYRHRTIEDAPVVSRWGWIAIGVIVLVAGCALPLGGGPTIAAVMIAQAVSLLNWRPGLRWKIVIAVTVLVFGVLLLVGPFSAAEAEAAAGARVVGVYGALLPAMTATSLWWWDVLITLDRARISEARLAATQERLRLATDVHDLQGHHLQVIALQLELATRLMPRDPDAGMAQLALARASVDGAQQGTRDLATRFRSVPLLDELANAQDLLRAAGHDAAAVCTPGVEAAPAHVLGPVIRETTTNILRHGAPGEVRLSIVREGGDWVYQAVNEAEAAGDGRGSGLDGIAGRVAAVGGTLEVRRDAGRFAVTVRVPAGQVAA
jgi:two-component system sensor histidine kinase DesK